MAQLAWKFLLLILLVLLCPTQNIAADNSAALESIDREIAAKQAKLAAGVQLRAELGNRISKAREAAQAMLDAEQQLGTLENNARIHYQNNALKVQMKLGVSIALLGPTALMPANNLLDAAATGVSLLVVDPVMNEIFNWMGLGNPMESKKQTLLSYAEGTFPSQARLEFWLAEQPTSDADVLERYRQIIKYAQQGIKEVRGARIVLIELYNGLLQLKTALDSRIEELKREIETLRRHRDATAGVRNEVQERPALPELDLSPRTSNAGAGYQLSDNSEIEKVLAQLNRIQGEIWAKNEQIGALHDSLSKKISKLYQDGESQRETIETRKRDQEKELYSDSRNPATRDSLANYCAPTNVPYSKAIDDATVLHNGYVRIETGYVKGLEELRDYYSMAADEVIGYQEIADLQQAYGDLLSLIAAYNSIQRQYASQLRHLGFYQILSAPQPELALATVKQAQANLTDYHYNYQQQSQQADNALQAQQKFWNEERRTMLELANGCIEQVRFSLEMQLEQSRLSRQLLNNYFAANAALQQHYQQLASSGILLFRDENNIQHYAVSEDWLSNLISGTPNACAAIVKLDNQLLPAAEKLAILKESNDSTRAIASGSGGSLGSNPIAEQNLPSLHEAILTLQQQRAGNSARTLEAGKISSTGTDLLRLAEQLEQRRIGIFVASNDRPSLHTLFNQQLNSSRELTQLSRILIGEAKRAKGQERIADNEAEELRKAYKQLQQRYLDELACMGATHQFNKELAANLPELDKSIDALFGKATFLDASRIIDTLTALLTTVRNLPLGEDAGYRQQIAELKTNYRQQDAWFTKNKPLLLSSQSDQIGKLLYDIGELLPVHDEHLRTLDELAGDSRILDFYNRFRDAYQAKNEALVMSLIHDDWSAAGGVTLFDLEDNLRNMYNVFDDIEYSISGLRFSPSGENLYNVNYAVTIRGVIYDNDLTHEEVSSVSEQVIVEPSGQVRIYKTLEGNYWSVQ